MNIEITSAFLVEAMDELGDDLKHKVMLRKPNLDGLTFDRLTEALVTLRKAERMVHRSYEFLDGYSTEDIFNHRWDQDHKGV